MAINTRITGLAEYGQWMKVMFCGEAGTGKTLISSTFPNPFFISAEGGLMSIARRFLPYTNLESTQDLKEIIGILRQDPKTRATMLGANTATVDTIVIDTIDEVQKVFMKERVKAKKDEAFNLKDYGWLNEQMQSAIRAFRNLDMNVVLTCHIKPVTNEETGKVTYKPGMAGQVAEWIPSAVDLSLLLNARTATEIQGGKAVKVVHRYAQAMPDSEYSWIKDRSGRLPAEFEVNFEDDYQRLFDLIYKGLDEEFAKAKEKARTGLKNVEKELRADPFKGDDVADRDAEQFAGQLLAAGDNKEKAATKAA